MSEWFFKTRALAAEAVAIGAGTVLASTREKGSQAPDRVAVVAAAKYNAFKYLFLIGFHEW